MQFDDPWRAITASEVERWFGPSSRPKLTGAAYANLAEYFTFAQWPTDKANPLVSWEIMDDTKSNEISMCRQFHELTTKLVYTAEALRAVWISRAGEVERQVGYDTLRRLEDAAREASPLVERLYKINRRPAGWKRPKLWHIYSVAFAQVVIRTLVDAGHKRPAISRNSVVVRVVHHVLVRMGFPDIKMTSQNAIAAHLNRCNQRFPVAVAAASAS